MARTPQFVVIRSFVPKLIAFDKLFLGLQDIEYLEAAVIMAHAARDTALEETDKVTSMDVIDFE